MQNIVLREKMLPLELSWLERSNDNVL